MAGAVEMIRDWLRGILGNVIKMRPVCQVQVIFNFGHSAIYYAVGLACESLMESEGRFEKNSRFHFPEYRAGNTARAVVVSSTQQLQDVSYGGYGRVSPSDLVLVCKLKPRDQRCPECQVIAVTVVDGYREFS